MRTICFYFQVHQPFRIKNYRFFNIGADHDYFDEYKNRTILEKVAKKCYLPANKVMLDLIKMHNGKFRIAYSISGTALDQFERYHPEVLESFIELSKTGCVEFLSETFSHSLAAFKDPKEFKNQIKLHTQKVDYYFNQQPKVFRNTELIYSDHIGKMIADMGFKAMLTEGAKHILGWKSPNYVYCNAINPRLRILLKNYKLSDDIAFRFSNKAWEEWPLTAEKYAHWLTQIDHREEVINLFMDYETFGEHQWEDTGIFDFLRALPGKLFNTSDYTFSTPSEVVENLQPVSRIEVPFPISWADIERDLTAWLGNELQDEAYNKLYSITDKIYKLNDEKLLKDWLYLQTSDHFYYMCTKWFADGDVHKYFNPYNSPYEAFINFMNVLSDFMNHVDKTIAATPKASLRKRRTYNRKNQAAVKETDKEIQPHSNKVNA